MNASKRHPARRVIPDHELTEEQQAKLDDVRRRHSDNDFFRCATMVEEVLPSGERQIFPLVECEPDRTRGSLKFPDNHRTGGWYF
ncbi:MAG TPA: hypothetical protein VLB83_00130 [Candidatus Paceibacterota bacterium]|nr:hypothetical protein [Candidatus Paceibacterota bacterium]